jgi:thiamine biosynthesis protein ThiS
MSTEIHERIAVFVNGHARQVGAETTLGDLAQSCGLDPKRLLVELNLRTLPREEWPAQALQHGDRVEFIQVVAGG